MKDRYEQYCFRFDTKDFFPGTWEKMTPTEQSEWKKKRAAFEKRRGQKRTRRRRRMSGDAILVTLAAAMAVPTLVLSQMAIWESERILAEGIPEPPPPDGLRVRGAGLRRRGNLPAGRAYAGPRAHRE